MNKENLNKKDQSDSEAELMAAVGMERETQALLELERNYLTGEEEEEKEEEKEKPLPWYEQCRQHGWTLD